MNKSLIADALESKSWPFEEAKKILKRIGDNKKNIIFETGYGPSGCLLYTSPSPRDISGSRMPSSA